MAVNIRRYVLYIPLLVLGWDGQAATLLSCVAFPFLYTTRVHLHFNIDGYLLIFNKCDL